MKSLKSLLFTSLLGVSLLSVMPTWASEKQQLNSDSRSSSLAQPVAASQQQASGLFVNLTTDDPWRAVL